MKKYGSFIILGLLAIVAIIVMLGQRDDRAGLSAVMELASDAQQDLVQSTNKFIRLSDEEENQLGQEVAGRIGYWGQEIPDLSAYVTAVAKPMVALVNRPKISYTFRVVDTGQVNAFALPGGQIFVFRGLIDFADNEAELASILGHEISHVDLRHCVELFQLEVQLGKIVGRGFPGTLPELLVRLPANLTVFAQRVLISGYRKYQEFDADVNGMNLATRSGYKPEAAIDVMKKLQDRFEGGKKPQNSPSNPIEEVAQATKVAADSYFRSHPPGEERVRNLKDNLVKIRGKESPYLGKENLKRRIALSKQEFPNERVP